MIHELVKKLGDRFKTPKVGCPLPVLDRESMKPVWFGKPRIVLDFDKDSFGPPLRLSSNPKKHFSRKVGVTVEIYARSAKPGAASFEHRHVVEEALDQALVGLRYACAELGMPIELGSGGFFVPPDSEKTEELGGAAYRLSFTYTRAVSERSWSGDYKPEGSIGAFSSKTNVTTVDGNGDPTAPTTACGE